MRHYENKNSAIFSPQGPRENVSPGPSVSLNATGCLCTYYPTGSLLLLCACVPCVAKERSLTSADTADHRLSACPVSGSFVTTRIVSRCRWVDWQFWNQFRTLKWLAAFIAERERSSVAAAPSSRLPLSESEGKVFQRRQAAVVTR